MGERLYVTIFHSILGLHIPLPRDLSRVRLRSSFLLSVTRTCTTSDSSRLIPFSLPYV